MTTISKTELRIQGDPKRPQEIKPYVPPKAPEDQQGDFRLILAMMCGLTSMLTKIPWFGWLGLLMCLVYFAHAKSKDFDLKSSISAVFFCSSGLVGSYIAHLRPPRA